MEMDASISRAAIAHYHELLQAGHWQATQEQLTQAAREMGITSFAPEALPLRPFFIEPPRYAALKQAAQLVTRAVVTPADRALADAHLRLVRAFGHARQQRPPENQPRACA
jgi:hypothetical protein